MDTKELQQKNENELVTLVNESREALRKLRFNNAGSGSRDGNAIRNTRKEIARVLTELNTRTATSDA